MQRIIAAAFFALLIFAAPSHGQSIAPVVLPSGCGTGNLANGIAYLTEDATGNLCAFVLGGSGGGLSVQDGTAFTAGTSHFTPGGGFYNSTPQALGNGDQGTFALSQYRSLYVDIQSANSNLGTQIAAPPNLYNSGGNLAWGGTTVGGLNAGNVNVSGVGGTAVVANPCMSTVLIPVPISQAASTQILGLASGKKNYVCSIFTVGSDAENISLVEGTGSVCGTGTTAIIGGTTAANGANFSANAGFAFAGGGYPVAAGTNASYNICLLQSGTGREGGVAMIAQQ